MSTDTKAGMAGLLLAALLLGGCGDMGDAEAFDARQWREGERDSAFYARRHRMVDALLAGPLQPGMSRADLLALLGEPDDRSGGRFYYTLGSSYGADVDYLVIAFDAQDRVASAQITRG